MSNPTKITYSLRKWIDVNQLFYVNIKSLNLDRKHANHMKYTCYHWFWKEGNYISCVAEDCVLILKGMTKIINVGTGMAERFVLEVNSNPLVMPDEKWWAVETMSLNLFHHITGSIQSRINVVVLSFKNFSVSIKKLWFMIHLATLKGREKRKTVTSLLS